MGSASIVFSGNIIEELSRNIPSSLFALSELIKNAYDAFSPDVTIRISQKNRTVTIIDSGDGMGESEIQSLFHISKSNKKFGQAVERNGVTRLTQGSKGLGFLSAFKFGDRVEWTTCKDGIKSKFSASKSDLVSKDSVAGTEIPITTEASDKKGTTITISSTKEEIEELLLDLNLNLEREKDLDDNSILEKLAATIIDDSFNIKIEVENSNKSMSTLDLKDFLKEDESNQLFYVSYNSKKSEADIFHKGELLESIEFALRRSDYSIDIELVIFYFGKGKNSKNVSSLYKRIHDGALHPLIYINRNLFNNTVIFDPEILRKKSSDEMLPQMIGRVNIRCESPDLEFNSDRTNFVENSLTKCIIKDLLELNKDIQARGAILKKSLKKNNKVPTGKASPTSQNDSNRSRTASIIIDKNKPVLFYVPSDQILLEEYILQARDSFGNEICMSDIEITIDGDISRKRSIPSIESPCEKTVFFRYNDVQTELVSKEVKISFEEKISNISGGHREKSLFTIKSSSDYTVGIETVADIINAIDIAYSSKSKEELLPLIACSTRAIFEISAEKVLKTHKSWFTNFNREKLSTSTKREIRDSLLLDVIHIVLLIKKNQALMTAISEASGIRYKNLTNLMSVQSFKVAVKESHIGAHNSTRYLSKPKIESCADSCGLFAVMSDILINLTKETLNNTKIHKIDESELDFFKLS